MDQLWTIVFVFVVAAAFAVAHWHDRDDAKKSEPGAVATGSQAPRTSSPRSRYPVATAPGSELLYPIVAEVSIMPRKDTWPV
jgi:hypothetical protein